MSRAAPTHTIAPAGGPASARAATPKPGRRSGVQARAKATIERILDAAATLIAARGADQVTMTEIAAAAGVAIGSLYQYFADRRAIHAALFRKHQDWIDAFLDRILGDVQTMDQLIAAAEAGFDEYYTLHQRDPLVNAVWGAMQTDSAMQALDMERTLGFARRFQALALRIEPRLDPDRTLAASALLLQMSTATARFARAAPDVLHGHAVPIGRRIIRDTWRATLEAAGPAPKADASASQAAPRP